MGIAVFVGGDVADGTQVADGTEVFVGGDVAGGTSLAVGIDVEVGGDVGASVGVSVAVYRGFQVAVGPGGLGLGEVVEEGVGEAVPVPVLGGVSVPVPSGVSWVFVTTKVPGSCVSAGFIGVFVIVKAALGRKGVNDASNPVSFCMIFWSGLQAAARKARETRKVEIRRMRFFMSFSNYWVGIR